MVFAWCFMFSTSLSRNAKQDVWHWKNQLELINMIDSSYWQKEPTTSKHEQEMGSIMADCERSVESMLYTNHWPLGWPTVWYTKIKDGTEKNHKV